MLEQYSEAIAQILKHFVLQSLRLQPERIPERTGTAPQQIEFVPPVQFVPLVQHRFTVAEFGFPLLAPIRAQTARDDHADQRNQPEPEAKALYSCRIRHEKSLAAKGDHRIYLSCSAR